MENLAAFIRGEFDNAHNILNLTIQDVTSEQAHWSPPGKATPVGAQLAHIVTSEDMLVNGFVKGGPPLFATTFAGKTGMSSPPPAPSAGGWADWASSVEIDLGALSEYGKAVFASTDEYVGSLDEAGLERELDLSAFNLGKQSVSWFLSNVLAWHVNAHCGEISCLKGLQGAKGYPF
ncbi:MAG: DinB family protein [Dehalococcoidia bacterium]